MSAHNPVLIDTRIAEGKRRIYRVKSTINRENILQDIVLNVMQTPSRRSMVSVDQEALSERGVEHHIVADQLRLQPRDPLIGRAASLGRHPKQAQQLMVGASIAMPVRLSTLLQTHQTGKGWEVFMENKGSGSGRHHN